MDDILRFLAWYAALCVAGILGLPIAWRFLGTLPNRGLSFARLVGLLAIATAYGLIAMTGFVSTGLPCAVLAVACVAVGSAVSLLGSDRSRWWDALRVHSRELWLSEAIFLAALVAGALVRAHHPDIMATGKPEEFTVFNGLLRSRSWPPQDPWLAGHALAQPYFGWVFIVCLTVITGVPGGVAFNLAVATVFALSISGVFAVVASMTASGRERAMAARTRGGPGTPVSRGSLWPAALAPVVIMVAGNLYGTLAILHANGALADLTIVSPHLSEGQAVDWTAQDVWSWLDTQGLAGPPLSTPEHLTLDPGFWWWYEAGRVIKDRGSGDELPSANATTAFPALSFVLGDLEPHVLGLPWVLLAIGVVLAGMRVHLAPNQRGEAVVWLIAAAVVFGALSASSPWWAPIIGGLIVAAPIVGLAGQAGWWRMIANGGRDLALGLITVPLGLAAYAPFLMTMVTPGLNLVANLEAPTRLQQSIVAYSPIFWLMGAFVVGLIWWERSTLRWQRGVVIGGAATVCLVSFVWVVGLLSGANPQQLAASSLSGNLTNTHVVNASGLVLRRLLDGWTTVLPALGLGVCVAGLLGSPHRAATSDDGSHAAHVPMISLLLVAAACAAFLIPEWIYWQDGSPSRSTTLTNLSFQAWVLGGIGAWVGTWWLVERFRESGLRSARPRGQRLLVNIGLAVTVMLLLLGLLYTVLAVRSIATAEPASLDGLAYIERTYPDDFAATVWLSTHAEPNAIVVEAIDGDDWATGTFSRISMITGLPTIVGWPGREARWRAGLIEEVGQRKADVARIYVTSNPSELTDILVRYNVSYVIVGALEQTAYDIPADAALLTRTCGCLDVAFAQGSLTVLRVVDGLQP